MYIFCFSRTKDLFTFHVCNSSCARQSQDVFQNCMYKLLHITKLGCYMQEYLTLIKPLMSSTTLLEMRIQCQLFESSNIVIQCYNV